LAVRVRNGKLAEVLALAPREGRSWPFFVISSSCWVWRRPATTGECGYIELIVPPPKFVAGQILVQFARVTLMWAMTSRCAGCLRSIPCAWIGVLLVVHALAPTRWVIESNGILLRWAISCSAPVQLLVGDRKSDPLGPLRLNLLQSPVGAPAALSTLCDGNSTFCS